MDLRTIQKRPRPAAGVHPGISRAAVSHQPRAGGALDLTTLLKRVLSLSIQNVGAINGSIIVLDEQGQPVESAIVVGEKLDMNVTSRLAVRSSRALPVG
jgi:hypothetical protein